LLKQEDIIMKIVFMGTPDFAVPTLEALIESDKHEVVAVISQPDKPKGRGKKLQPTPVKEAALAHNIPVYQPERIKDEAFMDELEKIEADFFVVVAYGQILSRRILMMPKYGSLNVHGSILPKYRGAAPIQWALINGEPTTGITIMFMNEKCDEGDLVLKKEVYIDPNETYGSLHDRLKEIGADCLMQTLDLIEAGKARPVPQDHSQATYAPMIKKPMCQINWEESTERICNKIRAFNPFPGAYTFKGEEMIKIHSAKPDYVYTGRPGRVVNVDPKKGFNIATSDGSILVEYLCAQGGKVMRSTDYMRGHEILHGEKFEYKHLFKLHVTMPEGKKQDN
jgi:methionyl-tRNA formyltransferase